jgi:type IV pilus assembly protein PilZ
MFDLRILASLFGEHEAVLAEGCDCAAEATRARELGRELEISLMPGARDSEYGDWLMRAWTLLAVTYEETCRIARFLLHGVRGTSFPSLAALARAQRGRRRKNPPAARGAVVGRRCRCQPIWRAEAPRRFPGPKSRRRSLRRPQRRETRRVPSGPKSRTTRALAHPEPNRSEPRFSVVLQVNISSDSNLYVGFTENLSNAGIFVATHVLRPIGSSVEVNVRFPGRQEPVRCRGEVRWIREHSANRDAWPGMGIRFDHVDDEDKATLSEFLQTREPIFFVE